MLEEGVLKPLLRLTDSSNPEVRKEVARTLALFASKRDSHPALVRAHAASRMIAFLNDPEEAVVRYGVLGVANLAVTRESHQVRLRNNTRSLRPLAATHAHSPPA